MSHYRAAGNAAGTPGNTSGTNAFLSGLNASSGPIGLPPSNTINPLSGMHSYNTAPGGAASYFGGYGGSSATGGTLGTPQTQYYSSTPPNAGNLMFSSFGQASTNHMGHLTGHHVSPYIGQAASPFHPTRVAHQGTPAGSSGKTNSNAMLSMMMMMNMSGGGTSNNALFANSLYTPPSSNTHASVTSSSNTAAQNSRNFNQPHQHAKLARFQAGTSVNTQAANSIAGSVLDLPAESNAAEAGASNTVTASEWTALDIGGMAIRNLSPALFSSSFAFLTTLYLNHNQLTALSPEIAKLSELRVLHLSSNRLKSVPPEMGRLTKLTELLLFDNLLTTLPFDFGALYKLETLGLDGNPWHDPLYSLLQKDPSGLSVIPFLRDHAPPAQVYPNPPDRTWISTLASNDSKDAPGFSIASFNILSQNYADPIWYRYVPSWALAWSYRKEAILAELTNFLNADLIALQEVELAEYEDTFMPALQTHGYLGTFFPKSRAKTMSDKAQQRVVDGCVLFYKSDVFSLVEPPTHLEYAQLAMHHDQLLKSEHIYNRVMNKDNIGLLLVLNFKLLNRPIIVVNTHLHWDPDFKDVKLLQAILLLECVAKKRMDFPDAPVILTGDFNSMPDSGVYQLLASGLLPAQHPDFLGLPYDPFAKEGVVHNLPALKDVYHSAPTSLTEPTGIPAAAPDSLIKAQHQSYTNVSDDFRGIIDYIFYTLSTPKTLSATKKTNTSQLVSLVLSGFLSLYPKEYFDKIVGLPNPHHPSDHLPLMAEFKFQK
jgi:CCR4-NOT transcription complex subunit 6